ncbi:MAG TPA: TolC family protein [Dissulfurispiraceae bacterium]|nr:TolC family protein [Dissulfurispiraceae bacterium]
MNRSLISALTFLGFAAALLFSSAAHAVELTLEQCVERAVERNAGYQAIRTEFAGAGEDVTIARSGMLPRLKLGGFANYLDRPGRIVTPPNAYGAGLPSSVVESSLDNRSTYGLSGIIEHTVFAGGSLYGNYLRSKIFEDESGYAAARQKAVLVFEVKRAFYELLREQIHREALERAVAAKQERLRVTAERHKEGIADKEDLLLADTDAAGADLALYRSKNRVEVARTHLANLIEHGDADPLHVRGELRNAELDASLHEVREAAFSLRDDVKTSLKKIERMEQEIAIARGEYYPKVTAQGSYTTQRETNIDRPTVWALMLRLDWTLFEWGRTGAQVRKASLAAERARHEHRELLKRVSLEVERTWREVKDREQEIGYFEKRLRAGEYFAQKNAEKYRERSVKLAEFLHAESEFINAHHDYIAALHALNVSIAALEVSVTSLRDTWFEPRPVRTVDYRNVSGAKHSPRPKQPGKLPPPSGAGESAVKQPDQGRNAAETALTADALAAAEARQAGKKNIADPPTKADPVRQQDVPDAVLPAAVTDGDSKAKAPSAASQSPVVAPAEGKTEQQVCALPQGTAYYLQVVSFRERSNSEKAVSTIRKKLPAGRPVMICEHDGWFKVRVAGFSTAEAAKLTADKIGIRKAMVVRVSHAGR